jgi:hypothetical protein
VTISLRRLAVLVTMLGAFLIFSGHLDQLAARLTGTNPTGSSADAWCVGSKSNEACVDSSGSVIPTTDNDADLGTSSLRWRNLYLAGSQTVATDLTVAGNIFKTMVATTTVIATGNNPLISAASACGGILRLTGANANVTSAGFSNPAEVPGCILYVMNVGTSGGGLITFVTSSTFIAPLVGGNSKDIQIGTNDVVIVGSSGNAWVVLSSVVINN